jgi:hypothetical protein
MKNKKVRMKNLITIVRAATVKIHREEVLVKVR